MPPREEAASRSVEHPSRGQGRSCPLGRHRRNVKGRALREGTFPLRMGAADLVFGLRRGKGWRIEPPSRLLAALARADSLKEMTKQQLVEAMVEETGAAKSEVEGILDAVLEKVVERLASGEKVEIRGFGSFEVRETKERGGRNPGTGEAITIPASRKALFKASKEVRQRVAAQAKSEEPA
jgi:nucleoid DNA-binding protein